MEEIECICGRTDDADDNDDDADDDDDDDCETTSMSWGRFLCIIRTYLQHLTPPS